MGFILTQTLVRTWKLSFQTQEEIVLLDNIGGRNMIKNISMGKLRLCAPLIGLWKQFVCKS